MLSAGEDSYLVLPDWFEQFATASAAPPAEHAISKSASDTSRQGSEWIVQFKSDSLSGVASIDDSRRLLEGSHDFQLVEGLGRVGQVLISTADGDADAVSKWLSANPNVQYFEPNQSIWSIATIPNDSRLSELWGMNNTGQTGGANDSDIDAPEAWDLSTGSASVVVGIIDTGVDYNHPDLAANIWTNPGEVAGNGIDDDGNGFVDDIHGYDFVNNDGNPIDDAGHGTHVAGTIAAVGNNGVGVSGVNWSSSIMALKFLDAGGGGNTANAVRAVNYATLMRQQYGVNIRVTNNSWGGGGFNQALRDAINGGANAGILFVAAAGNDASDNDGTTSYPSGYDVPTILAVAATDHADVLARFSNYGATSVDVAAPGVNILSTLPNNTYGVFSGTSMATPHVVGVAALAWALSPASNINQIRGAILAAADPVVSLDGRVVTGGRLNARRTLEQLGMNVTASAPAAGAAVSAAPIQFEVSFTHAFDPQTLDAADFLVNNVAASSATVVDSDTAAFSFATSPVTVEGPQTMRIPQGAVTRANDGDPVRQWQAAFYFDAIPTLVVSSDPAQGATLSARPSAIVLNFNEPIDPASVGIDDLKLDQGIVVAATPLTATSARYEVRELIEDGLVSYELRSAAILDAHGNPASAHVGGFTIDDPLINHYRSTDVPRQIADLRTMTSIITIPSALTIADIDVGLDITHTYDADLDVTLIAPDGRRVELFTDVGGGGANFVRTVLDDEAGTAIQAAQAPFTGRFRPEGQLSVLDGADTVGTWTLEIKDDAGADVGVLNSWELIISQAADIPPRIIAVAPLPNDQGRTWRQIDVLSVQFSESMQPQTVNAANWDLREAGPDASFDTPDDVLYSLATSPAYAGGLTAHLAIAQGALPPGHYRFTATSGLLDLTGNPLDGNGDRSGGDAYVTHFTVVIVPADPFEPNDSFAQATDLGDLGSRTETNLSIHAANNDDYYRFTAAITGALTADILFSHAEGDLNAELYDANQTLLSSSASTSDNERILRGVTAGQSYYLRVYGNAGALSPGYILQLDVSESPPGDRFEPNDSFNAAHNFAALIARTETDLSIHFPDNDDYYRFFPSITGTFAADVVFSHAAGDIDVELYDASQTRLTYSDSRNNDERVVWNVSGGQTYYLRVFGYGGAMNPRYTLQLLVSQGPVADRFEPNDSFASATDFGPVESRTESSLSIHEADNDDYYRFTAATTGALTADVSFADAAGDLDVALYDGNQDYLSSSESTSDLERIVWLVTAGQTYFLHVYGYDGATNPNYSVQLDVSEAPAGDRFEPNDSFSQATNLGNLTSRTETNLSIHFPDNEDFYRLTPAVTGTLTVDVFFRHFDGDIDMALYDSNQSWLDSSESTSDIEHIVFNVTAGRTYYLEIYGFDGETNPNYTLSASIGVQGTPANDTVYLKASANGARIEVYDVFPLPPGSTPYFTWPMNATLPLPIDTFGGDDRILVDMPAGASGPASGLRLDAGAGSNNQLLIRGGGMRVDSVSTGGTLNTTVLAGAQLTTSRLMQNALVLAEGSKATLLLGGGTSVITSLTLLAGATLDISNNALVVDYSGPSPAAAIREQILSGRGTPGFGASWTGTGINSSAAAQANQAAPESKSVAYAENALLPLGAYSVFRGQTVDSSSILIAYTHTADANLDGVVNDDDVTVVGASYAPGIANATWAFGDFEYNGFIDDDDVTLLGVLYNPAANPAPPAVSGGVVSGASFPSSAWERTPVVAWSPDDATSATEGLPVLRDSVETSGRADVRGQATRAQQDGSPTTVTSLSGTDNDGDELLDLLAEAIVADGAARQSSLGEPRLATSHKPRAADTLWPDSMQRAP